MIGMTRHLHFCFVHECTTQKSVCYDSAFNLEPVEHMEGYIMIIRGLISYLILISAQDKYERQYNRMKQI